MGKGLIMSHYTSMESLCMELQGYRECLLMLSRRSMDVAEVAPVYQSYRSRGRKRTNDPTHVL